MTRSSRLKAMGLVETEPRAESRVFEPLVLLNTPDGLSYIVLGRYNRTVVTWARLKISRDALLQCGCTTGETIAWVFSVPHVK